MGNPLDEALGANFSTPGGAPSVESAPPLQPFNPVADAANFQAVNEVTGEPMLVREEANAITPFQPEPTPEAPAPQSPVGEGDFLNVGGTTEAAPPPHDDLVNTLLGGELSNVEIANLTGALEPVQGGFGGGAHSGLVRSTGKALKEANAGLADAEGARDAAYHEEATATVNAAETKARSQERTAELSRQKIVKEEERAAAAQSVFEIKMKEQEGLQAEAVLERKRYVELQTRPEQSMGQRVLASIAIAFSAFGSAIQRQQGIPAENLAYEIIQQQVDNEFRRQQLELQAAGKQIEFTSNAIAQNSALLKDQMAIDRAAQLSIISVYEAKAQSVLDSSAPQETRDKAQLAITSLGRMKEEKEAEWEREKQRFAQAAANNALKSQGDAQAAASRARRSAESSRMRILGQALSADRGERIEARKLELKMQQKTLQDARSLSRKTALPAGQLAKSNKAINTMLLHLETLDSDPDLTGFGVAEGRVGEMATAAIGNLGGGEFEQMANANRKAANEIARAYRLITTGQQSTDAELERIMRDQGIAPGQPVEVFRISLENRRSEMADVIVQNIVTNPESIQSLRPSGLKLALDSGRLGQEAENIVMQQLAQFGDRGLFQSGGR